jgi:hypothetical protein
MKSTSILRPELLDSNTMAGGRRWVSCLALAVFGLQGQLLLMLGPRTAAGFLQIGLPGFPGRARGAEWDLSLLDAKARKG